MRPGHIFPLIAREGGVLIRSGHTEAAVDMSRLAGLPPVGLIAELVNDDGTVKRLPDILTFAKEHKLLVVSIDDLIAYRQQRESLITRDLGRRRSATAIGRRAPWSIPPPSMLRIISPSSTGISATAATSSSACSRKTP